MTDLAELLIDQRLIDAPDFPRGAAWWRKFMPAWVTVTVHPAGEVTLSYNGRKPGQDADPDLTAAQRRRGHDTLTRYVTRQPRLACAIVTEDPAEPCPCWAPHNTSLHGGHCCFRDTEICHAVPQRYRAMFDISPAVAVAG